MRFMKNLTKRKIKLSTKMIGKSFFSKKKKCLKNVKKFISCPLNNGDKI